MGIISHLIIISLGSRLLLQVNSEFSNSNWLLAFPKKKHRHSLNYSLQLDALYCFLSLSPLVKSTLKVINFYFYIPWFTLNVKMITYMCLCVCACADMGKNYINISTRMFWFRPSDDTKCEYFTGHTEGSALQKRHGEFLFLKN